jgi:cytidine deaminase
MIIIADDKIQSVKRCGLCQQLYLQYIEIASLVVVYTN